MSQSQWPCKLNEMVQYVIWHVGRWYTSKYKPILIEILQDPWISPKRSDPDAICLDRYARKYCIIIYLCGTPLKVPIGRDIWQICSFPICAASQHIFSCIWKLHHRFFTWLKITNCLLSKRKWAITPWKESCWMMWPCHAQGKKTHDDAAHAYTIREGMWEHSETKFSKDES
jgi:hypothetical protein